ncbi:hypothetical protein HII31_00666 [Pseudocercospora fuligena]|uniref:Uncharacterized protein n=1 Tax=Pseudocercospora fuligena TaxID=685502 RepID=A0A8H6VPN8_9PEZI|nr:hypothetical protein HII31_00666 [Pseudocercospora fuligena]
MDSPPETESGHISKKRKTQEHPDHEDSSDELPTDPSIAQAHDLTQSFHLLVTNLNEQIKAEKAKVLAQAAELLAKDQQISSLEEQRDGLQRSIDEDVTGETTTLLNEQLDQEKQKNAEITKRLAELARVESAKSGLEEKVEQLMKDKEELQRLALEHEETLKTTKARLVKRASSLRNEMAAMKTQHEEELIQIEQKWEQVIETRIRNSIWAAENQAEKRIEKAENKARKEIIEANTAARKSAQKARKYENVFNAARPLVRCDSNRDWPAFGQNMKKLSDAVKERNLMTDVSGP